MTVVRCSSREAEDVVKEAARLIMTEADSVFSETGHTWQKRFAGLPAYAPYGRDSEYPLLEAVPEGYTDPIILRENEQDTDTGPVIHVSFEVYNYHDPNGGILEGSSEPLREDRRKGEETGIHRAPVREGYVFNYRKGSASL